MKRVAMVAFLVLVVLLAALSPAIVIHVLVEAGR